MDDSFNVNLDLEFKRYLHLLRPYLGQLVDDAVIKVCDTWIQRLSVCEDNEKASRNNYAFALCYQLARGVLDKPFLGYPPAKLQPLSDDFNTDQSSTGVECMVINSDDPKTKILFNNQKSTISDTDNLFQEDDKLWSISANGSEKLVDKEEETATYKQICFRYNNPNIIRIGKRINEEEYECRANNLVKKLRDIKMQNILLRNELTALKDESKSTHCEYTEDYSLRVDNTTSPIVCNIESSSTLNSLKYQLRAIQESRNVLIQTISNLQAQVDNINQQKKNEIEDLQAKHALEIVKLRLDAREETTSTYENKIAELKHSYEDTIRKIHEDSSNTFKDITKSKDDIIQQKNELLETKNKEIVDLKNQIETRKSYIQSILNKFTEKPEDAVYENLKIKNQLLENRLDKMEKTKIKCMKIYEANLAKLNREKHLAECSLQLQLVKQRTKIVNDLTDENQTELNSSLNKLENKYKEIVANVQATAIQRRMQDQKALESILQATCGTTDANQTQFSSPIHLNQTYDAESFSLGRSNKNEKLSVMLGNKSYGDESMVANFCLEGGRMGELFERYVPQRDNCKTDSK